MWMHPPGHGLVEPPGRQVDERDEDDGPASTHLRSFEGSLPA
jgi:hypothetical protein